MEGTGNQAVESNSPTPLVSSRRNSQKLRGSKEKLEVRSSAENVLSTGCLDENAIADELQATLALMEGSQDPNWQQLKSGYETLLNLYKSSKLNEQRLNSQCSELSTELMQNSAKMEEALKLNKEEKDKLVSNLQQERDVLQSQLLTVQGTVLSLEGELENLKESISSQTATETVSVQNQVYRNAINVADGGSALTKVLQEKEELSQKLQGANLEIQSLETKLNEQKESIQSEAENKAGLESELNMLRDMLSTRKSEQDREVRVREKLEAQVRHVSDSLQQREGEIETQSLEIKTLHEVINKLHQQLKEEENFTNKIKKEREVANTTLLRLQQDFEEQSLLYNKLQNDAHEYELEIQQWEAKQVNLAENLKHTNRAKDALAKELKSFQDSTARLTEERDALRATNHSLELDINNLKRSVDFATKQNNNLAVERDQAHKNYVKAMGTTQKQSTLVKVAEHDKRSLEHEINAFREEAGKMRKLIFSLERERDNHLSEISALQKCVEEKEEALKIKELQVFDSRKKVSEMERKLKEQQSLYETVRSDRNNYSKNLVESQDELLEMRRKLKILGHQIEQLKDEVLSRDTLVTKGKFELSKLEKDKETLSVQVTRIHREVEHYKSLVQTQQTEQDKLTKLVSDKEVVVARLETELSTIMQERDSLGVQVLRRDEEIALLYEKVRLQASTLVKGETQYRERLDDIRVLKLEVKNVRREKAALLSETNNVDSLRQEIYRAEKELLREKTRVKALEEELNAPVNVHRWRKLAGSDPSTFELINRIQNLQKRLIKKTEEVVEKELLIQQRDKIYKELKTVLARQPGPELLQELQLVKKIAKEKTREAKSLASEINMYLSQNNELKHACDQLNKDLQEVRKKSYAEKLKLGKDIGQNFKYLNGAVPHKYLSQARQAQDDSEQVPLQVDAVADSANNFEERAITAE